MGWADSRHIVTLVVLSSVFEAFWDSINCFQQVCTALRKSQQRHGSIFELQRLVRNIWQISHMVVLIHYCCSAVVPLYGK